MSDRTATVTLPCPRCGTEISEEAAIRRAVIVEKAVIKRLRTALGDVAFWLVAEAAHPRQDPRLGMCLQAAEALRVLLDTEGDER